MARGTYSARRRQSKKFRAASQHTAAPKVNSRENRLLREDQKRAFSERGLLEDTKFQSDEITAPRQRELFHIFRHKVELPRSQYGRDQDNQLRRSAVVEIMHVRVRAGLDPPTEPLLWAGKGVDITNGLRRKLPGYFDKLKERSAERNSQRRFLEWSLEQPGRNGIPVGRVEWLKGIINQSVGPAEHMNMEARMRAFYYILACAKTVGSLPEIAWPDNLGKYEKQMHVWLLQQPCGFFENPNFKLIATYPLELNFSELAQWAKKAYGGGTSNERPIEVDSDNEYGPSSKERPIEIDSDDADDEEEAEEEESEVEFLPGEVGEMDEGDEEEEPGPSRAAQAESWARMQDRMQPEPVLDSDWARMQPEPVLDLDM